MDLRRRSKNRVVEAMAGGADLAIGQESACHWVPWREIAGILPDASILA
jgi:hypothetical protein